MRELTIDLQNGFEDDTVLIKMNGAEVFQATSVSTRYQIGLARSVKLDAGEARSAIEIILPDRALSKSVELDTSSPVYLGVSLTPEREITHRTSSGPFLYA